MKGEDMSDNQKTLCLRCNRPIFTAGDSFLPDPFSQPDAMRNIPIMDTYANGYHLGDCETSIAAKVVPSRLFALKADMAAEGKSPEEIEKELARRKAAWLVKITKGE
jgi:hypothetical protein